MEHLSIAKEFSPTPGPRRREEGKYSAEEFRETILLPRFEAAIQKNEKLVVDLDGVYGYGISFLEESFGGLARLKTLPVVRKYLEFKSDEDPFLVDDTNRLIDEAVAGSCPR